jgi:hypothetical protein
MHTATLKEKRRLGALIASLQIFEFAPADVASSP